MKDVSGLLEAIRAAKPLLQYTERETVSDILARSTKFEVSVADFLKLKRILRCVHRRNLARELKERLCDSETEDSQSQSQSQSCTF